MIGSLENAVILVARGHRYDVFVSRRIERRGLLSLVADRSDENHAAGHADGERV